MSHTSLKELMNGLNNFMYEKFNDRPFDNHSYNQLKQVINLNYYQSKFRSNEVN